MKIVDLTYPIEEGMPTFKAGWHTKVEISILGRHHLEGRETRKFVLGSHTGTHIDASAHFMSGGKGVDSTPLERLVGECHLVSFPNCEPMRRITVADVKSQLGKVEQIRRIVFRFDWSRNWGTEQYYQDWPYLTEELCLWLLQRGIWLIGLDTPSPDNAYDNRASGNDSPLHKLLLSREVILVEYLSNLDRIDTSLFSIIALPLRIKDADGSPARVIATLA